MNETLPFGFMAVSQPICLWEEEGVGGYLGEGVHGWVDGFVCICMYVSSSHLRAFLLFRRRARTHTHSHDRVPFAVEVVHDLHVEGPVRRQEHLAAGVFDQPDHRI